MKLERNWFGIRCEEFWFDAPGYLASQAPVAALRSLEAPARYDCRVAEATWLVSLVGSEADWASRFSPQTRASIRNGEKKYAPAFATAPVDRRAFFDAHRAFARAAGLASPRPDEQEILEVFLARDETGALRHGCAFLAFPEAGLYRYRYSVAVGKSRANAALIFAAMRRARSLGCERFDLGGYVPGAKPGSKAAGINGFKKQFGGAPAAVHFCLRAESTVLRLGLRAFNPLLSRRAGYRALEWLAARISTGR